MPVQKFRQLDYVMLLHATVLGMTVKDLVKFFSVWEGLYREKQKLVIITKNNILFVTF